MAGAMSAPYAAAQDLSGYNTALGEFENLIKSEAKRNNIPRQTDPRVAELLIQLTDSAVHAEKTVYPSGEFAQVIKACARTQGLLLEYIMFAIRDDPTLQNLVREKDAKGLDLLMDKGFGAFQPEMGRLESLVLLCNAKAITLTNEFSNNPLSGQALQSFKKGVDFMRRSNYKIYAGSVRRALNAALPADYRQQLMSVLSSAAPKYALILPPELRDDVVRQVKEGGDALPKDMKALAEEIVTKLSATNCVQLCSN